MPWRISSLRLCLTGMAIGLIACGGASSPPPSESTKQDDPKIPTNTERACDLLTKADAASILASAVEDDVDESTLTPMGDKVLRGRCYYEGDGGSVSLTVNKHIDSAYAGERFAKLRNRHDSDPSYRAMSGLGEDAFAEHDSLHVKRGDLLLSIELKRTGDRKLKHYGDKEGIDTLAAEKREIALEALKRLPPVPAA
jgi:hypothetical protein